ncbi:hypothetical protein ACQRIT_004484 [Beauveria bassiana]
MVQYAKNQPAGFVNHISKVAIIGASGNVGKHMTQALLQTGKHTVAALNRIGSKSVLPEGVIKAPVDYANDESLVGALKGQQFLIVSMAVSGGTPPLNDCHKLVEENLTGALVCANIAAAKKNGLSWTTMNCSFWYEFLLMSDNCYGIDIAKRMATLFGQGDVRIRTSTWLQCGRAAAAFLSLKVLPEDEQDAEVTMERWCNRPLFIESFVASQRDMLDSLHNVLGTTDKDWTVEQVDAQRRYDEGKKLIGGPEGYLGFSHCLYTRTFFEKGGGDFSDKVVNEKLGLPEEDVEEATQRATGMAPSAGEFEYSKGAH